MANQPEVDQVDRELLDGNSGLPPFSALVKLASRLKGRGLNINDYENLLDGTNVLEEVCTDGARYRPGRAGKHIQSAWDKADDPLGSPCDPRALTNLKREVVSSGVLSGTDLSVFLALVTLAEGDENRGSRNPVLGSVSAVVEQSGHGRRQVNDSMRRLEAAAGFHFPIREVTRYRLQSGPRKGQQTRLWFLNLGWRHPVSGVRGGVNLVSPQVRKLTSDDRLSYFRACIGNLESGKYLTTREMCNLAGLSYDNRARDALNTLYLSGAIERLDSRTRTGAKMYRWKRPDTDAEIQQAKAESAARIARVKAEHAESLLVVSRCGYDKDCPNRAPPGQRWCEEHERLRAEKTAEVGAIEPTSGKDNPPPERSLKRSKPYFGMFSDTETAVSNRWSGSYSIPDGWDDGTMMS